MLQLSDREKQVVDLAAKGYSDKQIAMVLRIRAGTVRTYWRRIQAKTEGVNLVHVVSLVLRHQFESIS